MSCSDTHFIPYGRQLIGDDDIAAVVEVLRSDWLTTGPKVDEFESRFADFTNSKHAVAVSSGTAALHAAIYAIGTGTGDEVIVPAVTFAASANCVVYQGGTPVFADVCPDTLLIDPESVAERITPRTKAIVAVDYAGQPCDYDALRELAKQHGLMLVSDACHALGGAYEGKPVGSLADLSTFSFHPVKNMTTGEGGMITTDDAGLAERMRCFRNHGITTDHRQRQQSGAWFYEMQNLGFNYRLSDIQCALGISQLKKVPGWLKRRQEIARIYDEGFEKLPWLSPLSVDPSVSHAYHLYVVLLDPEQGGLTRADMFTTLRDAGIGVNVHYIPVHLHPFYRNNFGTSAGLCPVAEAAYERALSLPMYPGMSDEDVDRVIRSIREANT